MRLIVGSALVRTDGPLWDCPRCRVESEEDVTAIVVEERTESVSDEPTGTLVWCCLRVLVRGKLARMCHHVAR